MLNGILVALLTVLQPSTPVQPELQGQPCTAQALVGTWQYGGKITSPGVTSVLKHVTPTHFFVVRIGPNDVVHSAHGGPYTLADDTYSETITHGFGGVFEMLRRGTVSFQCRISGDVWHIIGDVKGVKTNEQWKRVSGIRREQRRPVK